MKLLSRVGATVLAASLYLKQSSAQMVTAPYTDPVNNITFGTTWQTAAGADPNAAAGSVYAFGMVLPADALTKDATEYIGLLRCSITNGTSPAWCGLSHGQAGQMTQALLLMAWAKEGNVYTSFRYTSGYDVPGLYTGNATLTQISATVNATQFELVYRCQGCFSWNQGGNRGSVSTANSEAFLVLGRAAAKAGLENPSCPDRAVPSFHDNGFGQYGASLEGVPSESYASYAALATKAPPATDCSGTPTGPGEGEPTETPEPVPTCVAAPTKAYDYIVVGAGAAGIPIADRLSESGKSVLLIEKGPPSSGRWNGTMKPEWLSGTNLTRFDVPGLCNQIWVDSAGIACTDTDQMAGCVLGGGTAVNAALWWKPHAQDWDYNFPAGWKSRDLAGSTQKVFTRIPGTYVPSQDGKLYRQEGFNTLASGLNKTGWKEVIPNESPNQRNHTFGHTTYMYSNGERGGPMATYLVSASKRNNFALWMNTSVRRAVRKGGHVTGVELECLTNGGYSGTVNLTPTGRVIVAAGTFGSAKFLLRSGIGPTDQLEVVAESADGETFVSKEEWINLPVGYNLIDHLNTDLIVTHPDVVFYDFYEAWVTPNEGDKEAYLEERTGILTQSAPNIGPLIWDEIKGSDGIVRTLQWTARVEGNEQITPSKNAMTLSQYLGRGTVSRGRMTISTGLDTQVFQHPYLHNAVDKEAVIQGIKNLQAALNVIPNLTWVLPPANTTVEQFVNSMIVSPSNRRANHWMGTIKLGTDDGRKAGGTAVVDLDTKVYGTDNLFVVDASIFPGMVTHNPSAMIVIAAEQAAKRILALKPVGNRRPGRPGGRG